MTPTAKNPSEKFVTNESPLTDVSKSTDIIVKTGDLASTSQWSPPDFKTIPIHMHHSVTDAAPCGTTSVT